MNCDDKTCPWFSTRFSTGHCSHPTSDLCKRIVTIELTRPVFQRLKDYHFSYCEDVFYSSENKTSLDTEDMNLAIKNLLDEIVIFHAWVSGKL